MSFSRYHSRYYFSWNIIAVFNHWFLSLKLNHPSSSLSFIILFLTNDLTKIFFFIVDLYFTPAIHKIISVKTSRNKLIVRSYLSNQIILSLLSTFILSFNLQNHFHQTSKLIAIFNHLYSVFLKPNHPSSPLYTAHKIISR